MPELLTDVRLERDEQRTVGEIMQDARQNHLVLQESESKAMQEHDRPRPGLGVPSCRDAKEIIETVLGTETHVPTVHEVPFEDDVSERDEGIPYEWTLVNVDGVDVEEERTTVRVGSFGKGLASAHFDHLEGFLEDIAVRFWEGVGFGHIAVEDGPVKPCINVGLVYMRPRDLTEPDSDERVRYGRKTVYVVRLPCSKIIPEGMDEWKRFALRMLYSPEVDSSRVMSF